MKKTLHVLAYLIPLCALFALQLFLGLSLHVSPLFFVLFGLCLVFAPMLSVFRFSRFFRGFLYGFSIFSFSAGIPAAKVLGGAPAAQVMLFFGLFAVSLLAISRALPTLADGEMHLRLRGMTPSRTRKKLLTKPSYAFFFLYAAPLAALLSGWLLFIDASMSPASLFSFAALSVFTGLAGYLLYCILGAPAPRSTSYQPKKSRKILLPVFTLCLIVILTYVYLGHYHTAPEPEFAEALSVMETVFTPVLIGTFAAFFLGALLGLLLSFLGARLFHSICHGIFAFPAVLLSGILSIWFPLYIAVLLPLLPIGAEAVLEGRMQIRSFRQFPPQGRKKAVLWPLMFRPLLATLPFIGASSLFTSVFLHVALQSFAALSPAALLFAASLIAISGALLFGICFLVKEAKHHG